MSPFSKVEMSPFVILKWELQDERDGKSDATSDEPSRAHPTGSTTTSKKKDAQTTASGGTVIVVSATGKTSVQSLPDRGRDGPDLQAARPTVKQSTTGKNH